MIMFRLIVLALPLLAACSTAAQFTEAPMDRRSGDTSYRVEDRPGGFVIFASQSLYRFIPDPTEMHASCRQEGIALAVEEGHRRGIRVDVDERAVRTSAGRNGVSGMSSCTAMVPARIVP